VQSPEDTVAASTDDTEATNPVDRPSRKRRRPLHARIAPRLRVRCRQADSGDELGRLARRNSSLSHRTCECRHIAWTS
jgi:hypothetical protein